MGRYAPYSEYRDSGLDWLGNVPAHWGQKRFKFLFQVSTEKNGNEVVGEMLSVSGYRGIEVKAYEDEGHKRTEDELTEYRVVRPGQLVVNTMWLNYAGLGVSEYEGHVSPAYRSYWLHLSLYGRFAHHLLRSSNYVAGYTKYMQGIRPNSLQIKTDDFLSFPIIVPPENEQVQIAAFLDHETAKIDRLIAKQERLIELLKEKRQAVISHAVTKGLNPDAPMKDSGVEWLGEVPAHWDVKKLGYIGRCQNGLSIGGEYFGTGHPFVSYGDAYKTDILPEKVDGLVESTPSDRTTYSVLLGDVLFTRTSETVDEIGFSSTCLRTIPDATFAGFLIRFRPARNKLHPSYSRYFFRSDLPRAHFLGKMNIVTRASLSQDLLKKLPVLLPPLGEQERIAEYLNQKSEVFARLTKSAKVAIDLLREHRTALISAAVTGKIDVRGWRRPNQEPQRTAIASSA